MGALAEWVAVCVFLIGDLLARASSHPLSQYEALKFVVHFIGDIHQPLHCAFLSDHGGNDITGYFLNTAVNLHHVRPV